MAIEFLSDFLDFGEGFLRKCKLQIFSDSIFPVPHDVVDKEKNSVRKKVENPEW